MIETILREAIERLDSLLAETHKAVDKIEPPWRDFYGNPYYPTVWSILRVYR